ncbi:MAG: glycerol-3-phosphate 1-O-acyltransferase PlsY [Desulfovibrionaceae bacterium]|nr:glycerol-3-phosphate 1-O-acyltransferase PlsY [Desulfovibrionaceae bacterium]
MTLLLSFCAYVLGSIPFGLILARTFCGIDPRTAGSGNVGSTNVARLCGKKWGFMTLVCDILKGVIPMSIAVSLADQDTVFLTTVGLAAIIGHLHSCFLRFRGGKAVATSIGVLIPIAFWQLIVSALICIMLIWRSGFVSLGSLALVTVMPLLLAFSGKWSPFPLSCAIFLLVLHSHRDNIRRLLEGREKTWLKK